MRRVLWLLALVVGLTSVVFAQAQKPAAPKHPTKATTPYAKMTHPAKKSTASHKRQVTKSTAGKKKKSTASHKRQVTKSTAGKKKSVEHEEKK